MGTAVDWEGNIGSVPEFKEFPNGNKDPRRLLRLNVYFDNSIPKAEGGYEDRGGFWANVELWHRDAEHFSALYQKGMRVLVQGRAVMDTWHKDGEEYSAIKVQANRIAIMPARVASVTLAPSQHQSSAPQRTQQAPQADYAPDFESFDEDVPV